MATTPGGLPYPVGTDKVVNGDDAIHALATALDPLVQVGASAARAADLTVPIGTFVDVGGVIVDYPVRAGVRYRVVGFGAVYVGGNTAEVSHRFLVPGQALWPALIVTAPLNQKIGISNQFEWVAPVTGPLTISFQAAANAPATGLVLLAGGSVTVGVA